MKRLSFILGFVLLLSTGTISGQEYKERLGLPGDNLNLYAVLAIFQESPTLEEFELRLNDPGKMVNNLDLNGDNKIDYIHVIDYLQDDRHNIVLRVGLSKSENQDVAVITVLKDRYEGVLIQITGDPVLYGKDYIVEPNYYDDGDINSTPNPGYTSTLIDVNGITINVNYTSGREIFGWPISRYLFSSYYEPWRSPWSWGYYPSYWNPWRPYYWDYYYGYHYNWLRYYLSHFRSWNYHRDSHWRDHYDRVRSASRFVIIKRDRGDYKRTYSRPDQRRSGDERFRIDNPRNDRRDHNYNRSGDDRRDHNYNRSSEERNRKPAPSVIRGKTRPDVKQGELNRGDIKREEPKKPDVKKTETKKPEAPKVESKKSESTVGRRSRDKNQ